MLQVSRLMAASAMMLFASSMAFGQVNFEFFGNGGGQGLFPEEVEGWEDDAIRIAHDGNDGVSNGVSFDSAFEGGYSVLAFDFEFRIWNEDGAGDADGIGFAYADIEIFGEEADEDTQFWSGGEEPSLDGSIGIGFDTWMNSALDDPEGRFEDATLPNSFSLHYFGETLVSLPLVDIDENLPDDWISNGNVKRAHIEIEPGANDEAAVTLTVTDTVTDEVVIPFDRETVEDFEPYAGRIVFKARTGGEDSNHDIDNISLTHTTDGESTTIVHYGRGPDVGPDPRAGDYNENELLDAGDLDLHASEGIANQDLKYDANGDGVVNVDDRVVWTNDLKNTWMGDSDLNGVFDSSDFVIVFGEGKYETGDAATWGQGDWNGDMVFDSGDFVAAFGNGGYEMGERAGGPVAVTATVPEPSSLVLALLSLIGLVGFGRRRNA